MAGRSDLQKAEKSIQELCDKIRPALEKQMERSFKEYAAASYWTEPEGNTMGYGVKVYVGNDEYVHIYVTKDPEGELWLENFEGGRKSSDTFC